MMIGSELCVRMIDVGRIYRQGQSPVEALVGVTCELMPRVRLAVVGPSGSGKSTLLHLMAGIDTPTAGAVLGAGRMSQRPIVEELRRL